jgi:hypothetical protein
MRTAALPVFLLALALGGVCAPAPVRAADPVPEEYKPEEFAPWMWQLRRGEIVLCGSLPFTLFVVTLGYDGVRYLAHINDSDAVRYAPWPFRSANRVPYTTAENVGVAIGVVACSLAVSIVDYLIGEARERRAPAR